MMAQPRILTFNFHEPYLCLMAKTGLFFDVGVYERGPLARTWHTHYRPIPPNLRLVPEESWREELQAGRYDVVIAQNEMNALDVITAPCARLLVAHNRRTFLVTNVSAEHGDPKESYARLLDRLRDRFGFVFISESKRDDYGIPGRVIVPGIDVSECGGYTGEVSAVLRVGNAMRERNLMFDVELQEAVCAGLPNQVLGVNPSIAGSVESGSFADLCGHYRRYRCMLHVTRQEYEDGYNLAMLEAMAHGMPVVSLANRTSPLTDGVDGLVAADAAGLRARVESLLGNPDLARELGAAGRDTVAAKFPISAFAASWREAIFEAAEQGRRTGVHAGGMPKQAAEYYEHPRRELMPHVPPGTRRVLDVGCGMGALGRTLRAERGVQEVQGIEYVAEAGDRARTVLNGVLVGSVEELELPYAEEYFDCIVCADVLEHLVEPSAALRKLSRHLQPEGMVVISVPNARNFEVVRMLASGAWSYMEQGIMDSTHLRFFTRSSLFRLVEEAGLKVAEIGPLSMHSPNECPLGADGSVCLGKLTVHGVTEQEHPEFLVYQYVVKAMRLEADSLLGARRAFKAGEYAAALAHAQNAVGVDEGARWHLIARAMSQLGHGLRAEEAFRRAMAAGDDPTIRGDYGMLLVSMNRVAEARPLLEEALREKPELHRVRGVYALTLMAERRHAEAMQHLHAALDADYENVVLAPHYLFVANLLNRLADAEALVRRFVEFYPGNLDLACAYAQLLIRLDRKREARDRLDMLLLLSPGHEEARRLLYELNQER